MRQKKRVEWWGRGTFMSVELAFTRGWGRAPHMLSTQRFRCLDSNQWQPLLGGSFPPHLKISDHLHTAGKGFLILEEIYFTSFFLALKQNILNFIPQPSFHCFRSNVEAGSTVWTSKVTVTLVQLAPWAPGFHSWNCLLLTACSQRPR